MPRRIEIVASLLFLINLIIAQESSISRFEIMKDTWREEGYRNGYEDGYKRGEVVGRDEGERKGMREGERACLTFFLISPSNVPPSPPPPLFKKATLDTLPEKVSTELAKAYYRNMGYERGFKEGYIQGYRDGYSKSYEKAKNRATSNCCITGCLLPFALYLLFSLLL